MTWLLAILGRGAKWLASHPWVLAVLAGLAWVWRQRRKLAKARGQRDEAVLERDVAAGRAEVAEATAAVTVEVAKAQEAGAALAEEIEHAAPADAAPPDRIRAVDDRVREIARREGAARGPDRPAAVRDPAAPVAAGSPGRRDPER